MSRFRNSLATAALIFGTIALAVPANAQCVPDIFPNDWLQQQENLGGHTIDRHVGKTDGQLTQRLINSPNIAAAGSYPASALPDPRYLAAQATIAQGLASRRQTINNWAATAHANAPRAEELQAAAAIGRVALQTQPANVFDTQTYCVILRANGVGGCRVLTSFPTPALHGYCH